MAILDENESVEIDPNQHRKFLRLHAHIPMQFAIANDPRVVHKKTKTQKKLSREELFFRQASTLNISSGGMSLLVAGASSALREELQKPKQHIFLKISLPNLNDPVEFEGHITRFYTAKEGRSHQDIIGIQFDEFDQDNKATWLAFVNENRRRKKAKKIMFSFLALAVITTIVAMQTKLNLIRTTADKILLEKQIVKLANQKKGLNQNIGVKLKKIKLQNDKIKASEELIEINQKELEKNREENEKLETLSRELIESTKKAQTFLDLLEKKMYTYLVKESNGSIELSNKPDLKLFQSKIYKKLIKARIKRNKKIVAVLSKQIVEKFPKSPWARVAYARYLFESGKRNMAKKQFKNYLKLFLVK